MTRTKLINLCIFPAIPDITFAAFYRFSTAVQSLTVYQINKSNTVPVRDQTSVFSYDDNLSVFLYNIAFVKYFLFNIVC